MTNLKRPPASCACAFTRKAKGCMPFDAPMVSDPSAALRQSMAAGAPCGNDCRAAVPPDRSHDATSPIRSVVCMGDESVYILERIGSVLQEDGRRPGSSLRTGISHVQSLPRLIRGRGGSLTGRYFARVIGQESADRPGRTDRGRIRS